MILAITIIFGALNWIFLALFFANHRNIMDKYFNEFYRDIGYSIGPSALVACAGFAAFPFLNIAIFAFLIYKYNMLTRN